MKRVRKNSVAAVAEIVPVGDAVILAGGLAAVGVAVTDSAFRPCRNYLTGGFLAILEAGQYIKHFQYGCGVIVKRDFDRTTIDFDVHGIKIFVTSLMTIEPADGIPPKRRRTRRPKAVKPVPLLSSPVFVPGAK
jgi:hypothetical protein